MDINDLDDSIDKISMLAPHRKRVLKDAFRADAQWDPIGEAQFGGWIDGLPDTWDRIRATVSAAKDRWDEG